MTYRRWGRRVLSREDDDAIVAAIAQAERGNGGEVRVHIERRCRAQDPLDRARELFEALGMRETAQGTGVLLYVAVESRVACVFAGEGVHGVREPDFWEDVVGSVATGFAKGDARGGLCEALGRLGDLLRDACPGDDAAGDELPNEVTGS